MGKGHPISSRVYREGITSAVVGFAFFLRSRGFKVYQNCLLDALRSLLQIDILDREQFKYALRANLVSLDAEWRQFDELFDTYWFEGQGVQQGEQAKQKDEISEDSKEELEPEGPSVDSEEGREVPVRAIKFLEGVAYSPFETLEKKDLGSLSSIELQAVRLALRGLMQSFKFDRIRRKTRSPRKGVLDFPRIMREGLKREGYPFELFFKEKKRRLKRLMILADVSGSMEKYASFVLPFLIGLRGIGAKAEVFVFSTQLTSITRYVRHLSLEKALKRIAEEVPDWSGGTRIGYSLRQFNQRMGKGLSRRRSVVVLLSDGWDLGGKELLSREAAILRKKVHRVLWLNPVESDPDMSTVCKGMRAAARYIDYILPADSLEALRRTGRILSRIMVH
jgi:uncharacterized protein with von Willebrand factor type A (vWA) domain